MMYYNFVRIHKALRISPAMAAGVTDRLWEIVDIAKLVENAEAARRKERAVQERVERWLAVSNIGESDLSMAPPKSTGPRFCGS